MNDVLQDLLAKNDWLLADGATGTSLFNMGLASGDAPEFWNETHSRDVCAVYRGAVEAGSDIFLTNSFGSNAARLKLYGASRRALELSRIAAELGRDVADTTPRPVVVAGSMGPTGEIMAPIGTLSHASAVEIFHEQAEGLKQGGADVLWFETISAEEEFRAACKAAKLAEMPWCGTMSFDTAGRTMMGMSPAEMVALTRSLSSQPVAIGANCGVGASDLLRSILGFSAQGPELPIIAKGNAGVPKYLDGTIRYDGTPELMAAYALLARACGARIIGGCCGTTPDHLRQMRDALDAQPVGARPTLEEISKALGGFSSPPEDIDDGLGNGRTGPNRGSRR